MTMLMLAAVGTVLANSAFAHAAAITKVAVRVSLSRSKK